MGSLYRIICKREDFLAAAQHIFDICADGQLHADTTPM
jgi:hypothetical protein